MKLRTYLVIALFVLSFSAVSALPESIDKNGKNYLKCKGHLVKYLKIIKVADVGLYMPNCEKAKSFLQHNDKILRFEYKMDVTQSFFMKSAKKLYLKNWSQKLSEDEKLALEKFNLGYKPIKENDHYDLWHTQSDSLHLYKNGEQISQSNHKQLSYRYFSIWFGEYPAIKSLKNSFAK